jgi:ABC-type phosphate/phosphonate transport system permease subunit
MKLMNIVTMLVYSDDHGGGIVVANVFVVARRAILLLRVIPMVIYFLLAMVTFSICRIAFDIIVNGIYGGSEGGKFLLYPFYFIY